jgi:outer membrane protein TolC
MTDERRRTVDALSGIETYDKGVVNLGKNLLGREDGLVVQLSLQRAIALALRHNLDLRSARLTPAIAETQIIQAEADFDAVIFANADWAKTDNPAVGDNAGFAGLSTDQTRNVLDLNAGIRKRLTTGGQIQAETTLSRIDESPTLQDTVPYYDADVLFSINQPLLRNFGSAVATAQISLARNARRSSVEELRGTVITVIDQVEESYWDLLFARRQLLIQTQLLERTIEERNRLKGRILIDSTLIRLTEANSFVELRRADTILARQQWRNASDQLKRLLNAPDLPLADEALISPTDEPIEEALTFSLLDSVTTGLRERPELRQAVLAIRDTAIRREVAENQKLPLLDLAGGVRFSGVSGDGADEAYEDLAEANYIDYLVGLDFEYPLGNRAAEGLYAQRTLERRQAVAEYQRAAQDVVLEIKSAIRDIITQYDLIGAARAARRSAADNLRGINVQEEAGVKLTPEFLLDLKLQAQQRLADAETREVRALSDYMIAISELYRVQGTLLQRNGIDFQSEGRETTPLY